MYIEAFTTHFGELSDNRQLAKVTYPLEDILFITLCGVIAGAEGWSEIRDYADGHLDWFQQHGYLREGVPVDDTIARTISRIDPEQFRACFINWMKAVEDAFAETRKAPLGGLTFEQKRGRIEARTYHVLSANDVSKAFPQWPELKTLGMSMRFRQQQGKPPELTYRYHISSASLSEKQLAEAVRSHWAVENSLHWVLDVSMGEDDCQIHRNHGAENWSMLHHLALNMLRAESSKGSIPAKQKRAWMKASYLEAVLTAGFSSMIN